MESLHNIPAVRQGSNRFKNLRMTEKQKQMIYLTKKMNRMVSLDPEAVIVDKLFDPNEYVKQNGMEAPRVFYIKREPFFGGSVRARRTLEGGGRWWQNGPTIEIKDGGVIGYKRFYEFHNKYGTKTLWRLNEYAEHTPNLTCANQIKNSYVLCELYKVSGESSNNNGATVGAGGHVGPPSSNNGEEGQYYQASQGNESLIISSSARFGIEAAINPGATAGAGGHVLLSNNNGEEGQYYQTSQGNESLIISSPARFGIEAAVNHGPTIGAGGHVGPPSSNNNGEGRLGKRKSNQHEEDRAAKRLNDTNNHHPISSTHFRGQCSQNFKYPARFGIEDGDIPTAVDGSSTAPRSEDAAAARAYADLAVGDMTLESDCVVLGQDSDELMNLLFELLDDKLLDDPAGDVAAGGNTALQTEDAAGDGGNMAPRFEDAAGSINGFLEGLDEPTGEEDYYYKLPENEPRLPDTGDLTNVSLGGFDDFQDFTDHFVP